MAAAAVVQQRGFIIGKESPPLRPKNSGARAASYSGGSFTFSRSKFCGRSRHGSWTSKDADYIFSLSKYPPVGFVYDSFFSENQLKHLRIKWGTRQPYARAMAAGESLQKGKVVVLTGVSKGLGQSLAVELASRGHTVVGCARTEASVKELEERLGGQHSFLVVDVASDKEVKRWADATVSKFGVPDIVINNAGLINKNAPLWEVPVEEFDAVIDVNLKGTANVIRHFVPHMVGKQHGVIVNMSSGWGRSAAPDVAPYCATKWGVEGMSRALARELPRGCVAVALNPGVINTDMLQSCFGPSASMYQTANNWSRDAADLILSINANDNGTSMTVT